MLDENEIHLNESKDKYQCDHAVTKSNFFVQTFLSSLSENVLKRSYAKELCFLSVDIKIGCPRNFGPCHDS
jgi:hypothetical protein